jgi:hypothetical protein
MGRRKRYKLYVEGDRWIIWDRDENRIARDNSWRFFHLAPAIEALDRLNATAEAGTDSASRRSS